jgi:hypothetical protein
MPQCSLCNNVHMYDHKRFISEGPEKAEERRRMLQDRMQLAKSRGADVAHPANPS